MPQGRILIIDDDPEWIEILSGLLAPFEEQGVLVDSASSYAEAKRKLDRQHFDLVTMDIQLEKGKSYSEDWVFLQQWIICVVITAIFAVFGLLGAILAFRRRNYSIAVICALLGALSAGPFCSINLILGILAFGLILISRTEFS